MKQGIQKTVILVDLLSGGHHDTYIQAFAEAFLISGFRVLILFPEPEQIFRSVINSIPLEPDQLQVALISESQTKKENSQKGMALSRWKLTSKIINDQIKSGFPRPDLVFMMYLDPFLGSFLPGTDIDKVFSYQWNGIFFHPFYLRGKTFSDKLRKWLFPPHKGLSAKHCKGVCVLDDIALDPIGKGIKKPVLTCPDFTHVETEQCHSLINKLQESKRGRIIVGIFGGLDKRKGLLTFLRTIPLLSDQEIMFVAFGELYKNTFTAEELAFLESIRTRFQDKIFFHFERIALEGVFNGLVKECDIIFAAYDDFYHSSNSLTKAALFGRPVIVSDGYCMSERVKAYHLGKVISQGDETMCAKAILDIITEGVTEKMKTGLKSYLETHSAHKLNQLVLKLSNQVL